MRGGGPWLLAGCADATLGAWIEYVVKHLRVEHVFGPGLQIGGGRLA